VELAVKHGSETCPVTGYEKIEYVGGENFKEYMLTCGRTRYVEN